ncbi:MobA-like NTP transferase domain-containing protein [Aspergillus nidulans var. acristatus]
MVQPLLLAGGRSTRMGSRKELLCLADIPVYEQQLIRLHLACPESNTIFLSLPSPAALAQILESPNVERLGPDTLRLRHQARSVRVQVVYDHPDEHGQAQDRGPAGGLLAAHAHDRSATWLVVACDYPFFSVTAVRELCREMEGPLTCFENADGIYEPLLGIWTPSALALLEENVKKRILGPKSVVVKSRGKTIRPRNENWLFNMNTPAEYEQARALSEEIASITEDLSR